MILLEKDRQEITLTTDGLKIKICPGRLFASRLQPETESFIKSVLEIKLNSFLPNFKKIVDSINTNEDIEYFKSYRNEDIYEFACITRDLSCLHPDLFQDFYDKNDDIMGQIYSIFRYNKVYGNILSEKAEL